MTGAKDSRSVARLARDLEPYLGMDNLQSPETDFFLLSIDESNFAEVAAVLGLQARPASSDDQTLVNAYLRENDVFAETHAAILITTVPNVRAQ